MTTSQYTFSTPKFTSLHLKHCKAFYENLSLKYQNEPEYLQACLEILHSIDHIYGENPLYKKHNLLERLFTPERIIIFKVTWTDDQGNIKVNLGFRVQHCNAMGPYKGGLRFSSDVNLSTLKFLALEQSFKNALTGIPLGGAKGGADFDPIGKTENEIMRFCQAFMLELWRHIGPNTDVPAGDLNIGSKEVNYLFGMYKKLQNEFTGAFTGKFLNSGGSLIRPEATGYGVVYFLEQMLKTKNQTLKGKTCIVSGTGNVATHTCEKLIQKGAIPIAVSDQNGYVLCKTGITQEMIDFLKFLRLQTNKDIDIFAKKFGLEFFPNQKVWEVAAEIAIPCAIQNELDLNDAKKLVKNGVKAICEGANMPCSNEAIELFIKEKLLYAPGKASNAGGVSVSGLEMSQNASHLSWSAEEVEKKLQSIMIHIHNTCVKYGKKNDGFINYVDGANQSAFYRLADAIISQGVL